MTTKTGNVIAKAKELLTDATDGVRWAQLHKQIASALPDVPPNTIHGALHKFRNDLPADIYQPSRGLYRHIKFRDADIALEPPQFATSATPRIKEEDFYESFADWLVDELEECTKAIPVGGSKFRDKWGTPDVVGISEAKRSDIIKPPTEVVAAEIKLDLNGLITAFGQACSYKLFAHRAYIVVPQNSSDEDKSRLDALARIFGIGFFCLMQPIQRNPLFPSVSVRPVMSRTCSMSISI